MATRVQLEPRHDSEATLSELVTDLCGKAILDSSRLRRLRVTVGGALASARGLVKVAWHDVELSMTGTGGVHERSVAKALYDAASAADEQGLSGFLLMLDEAQAVRDDRSRDGEHPVSLLVAAVNALQEAEIPVGLVLCGLPTLRTNLLRARTYSERMFRGEEVSNLLEADAADAFVKPLEGADVSADQDRVVGEVEGYPYSVQLWGAEL